MRMHRRCRKQLRGGRGDSDAEPFLTHSFDRGMYKNFYRLLLPVVFFFSICPKSEIRSDCVSRSAFSESRRLMLSLTRACQASTVIVKGVTPLTLNVCRCWSAC